jgi:DNA polymerase
LAAPRAVLVFGDAASKVLLGLPVTRARGRWHEIETHAGPMRAAATFHPAHLLKRPADKAHAWADLQMVMQGLSS